MGSPNPPPPTPTHCPPSVSIAQPKHSRQPQKAQRFEDEELVAEGDAVLARFNYVLTLVDGSETTVPGPGVLPPRRWQDRGERSAVCPGPDAGARSAHGTTGCNILSERTRRPWL